MHLSNIASLANGTENGISYKFYLQVFPECLSIPSYVKKKKKSKGRIGIYYKQKQLSRSGFKFSHKIGAMIGFFVCILRVCQMVVGTSTIETKLHSIPSQDTVRSVSQCI